MGSTVHFTNMGKLKSVGLMEPCHPGIGEKKNMIIFNLFSHVQHKTKTKRTLYYY
jgi:hypothetical protein